MSRPKVAYEKADSGYLSDLIDSARKTNESDEALLSSSPSNGSTEFTLRAFDDTAWDDVRRSSARERQQNRMCEALVARIKSPTRFPIKPLPETLARAREEKIQGFSVDVRILRDGTMQRGMWVGGKWIVPTMPVQGRGVFEMKKKKEEEFKAEEREFVPKRIVVVNRRPEDKGFVPKRIVLVNRRPEDKGFLPKRLVIILRLPGREKILPENASKSGEAASPAADAFGRTRAATRKICEQGAGTDGLNKNGRKRKNEEAEEGTRRYKIAKMEASE